MRLRHVVLKEILYRGGTSALILGSITLCVGLIVFVHRVRRHSTDELDRAMDMMGNDIVILPAGTGLDSYLGGDIGEETMPQDYVGYAGNMKPALMSDCRGYYQRKAVIGDGPSAREVIIRGVATAVGPASARGIDLETGEAELGSAAAERLKHIVAADLLVIPYQGMQTAPEPVKPAMRIGPMAPAPATGPATLRIKATHEPTGTVKDMMVFVHVDVARRLYGMIEKDPATGRPKRDARRAVITRKIINVIEGRALTDSGMTPSDPAGEIMSALRSDKTPVEVFSLRGIAEGRRKALTSRAKKMNAISAGVFILGALVSGSYALLNVRQRRPEMGIMLAIAARPHHVAWMFIAKIIVLGMAGGVAGCAIGEFAAIRRGVSAARFILSEPGIYGAAMLVALAVTLLPSLLGVMAVSRIDPADTVRES